MKCIWAKQSSSGKKTWSVINRKLICHIEEDLLALPWFLLLTDFSLALSPLQAIVSGMLRACPNTIMSWAGRNCSTAHSILPETGQRRACAQTIPSGICAALVAICHPAPSSAAMQCTSTYALIIQRRISLLMHLQSFPHSSAVRWRRATHATYRDMNWIWARSSIALF